MIWWIFFIRWKYIPNHFDFIVSLQIENHKVGMTDQFTKVLVFLWHPHYLFYYPCGIENIACWESSSLTDYGRLVRKSPSLHGRKSNPNPIFCLPHRHKISDFFDLCFHWVSAVREFTQREKSLTSSWCYSANRLSVWCQLPW